MKNNFLKEYAKELRKGLSNSSGAIKLSDYTVTVEKVKTFTGVIGASADELGALDDKVNTFIAEHDALVVSTNDTVVFNGQYLIRSITYFEEKHPFKNTKENQ